MQYSQQLPVDANNKVAPFYSYSNITGQATTVVKGSAGFLRSITLNKPTATTTIVLHDAVSATTPIIGSITIPSSPMPVTLIYDIAFNVGLTVVTGTADSDITISYI